jgi:hypothetical protein
MMGYRAAFARKRCLPVFVFAVELAATVVAVGGVAFASLVLLRQVRLRRHLRRLRTMPLEHGRD